MNRRSLFKRASGIVAGVACALYIPADRLEFGVPKQRDIPSGGVRRAAYGYMVNPITSEVTKLGPGPYVLTAAIQDVWVGGVGIDYDGAYSIETEVEGYTLPAGGQP